MDAALKIPVRMSVEEFLAWTPSDHRHWQLVDGEPQAMAPPNRTHGAIQGELIRMIGNHLLNSGSACSVIGTPGVIPRVQSETNMRVPDLAATCADYQADESAITDPVLVVEILSPSNQAETWRNVWAYTTIPTVAEILAVRSTRIEAELLRRLADGNWPKEPQILRGGDTLDLSSIGLSIALDALYATSSLRARGP